MDIQKIQERFEDLMLADPDFDEGLLEKDEESCYVDSNIATMYSMFEMGTEVGEAWQAAQELVVPEGFSLIEIEKLHEIRDQALNAKYASLNNDSDRIFSDIEDVQLSIEAMIEAQEQSK